MDPVAEAEEGKGKDRWRIRGGGGMSARGWVVTLSSMRCCGSMVFCRRSLKKGGGGLLVSFCFCSVTVHLYVHVHVVEHYLDSSDSSNPFNTLSPTMPTLPSNSCIDIYIHMHTYHTHTEREMETGVKTVARNTCKHMHTVSVMNS